MNKIRIITQWLSLIFFLIAIMLLIILWFITGFNFKFYIIALAILIATYVLTYIFSDKIFTKAEEQLSFTNNKLLGFDEYKKLLELEVQEASMWWAYIGGTGFSFLTAGLATFQDSPWVALTGLIFLILANLVYSLFYYPKQVLLVRKNKIDIALKLNNQNS